MLTPKQLYDYQKECILFTLHNPNAMLWLQMGLGKTIIMLTTIVDLMRAGRVRKTIIFGPILVINSVWDTEILKWTHTNHLTTSIIRGDEKKRLKQLSSNTDIYLINYELMNWFSETMMNLYTSKGLDIPFDCIVYDEVSKLKNSTSLRMKGGNRDRKNKDGTYDKVKIIGFKKLIQLFKYRFGLTGTPASNGYLDLFGQYLAVDDGERLGKFITHYKDAYFTVGYNGWSCTLNPDAKELIESKVSDITIKMDAKDYLDMPEVLTIDKLVTLPPNVTKLYKELEKEMFIELDLQTSIEVDTKASLSNKCLQLCNGSPYLNIETRDWKALHDVKLKALEDIIEEAAGSPVICSYSFRSDAERIMKHFKKLNPVNLTDEKAKDTQKILNKFKSNEIPLLIGHPASMGHGIDGLQDNGSIMVWFGLNWSLELYEQMNGRINRQGQTKPVSIIRILCENTVDLAVSDSLTCKDRTQQGLKDALDRYRGKKPIVSFL